MACKTGRRVDYERAPWTPEAVPIDKAFLFFTDVGEYAGKLASSLEGFPAKKNMIPLRSLEFHLGRRDFQKIKGTLGDECLANRISNIDNTIQREEIRKILRKTVQNRLTAKPLRRAKMQNTLL